MLFPCCRFQKRDGTGLKFLLWLQLETGMPQKSFQRRKDHQLVSHLIDFTESCLCFQYPVLVSCFPHTKIGLISPLFDFAIVMSNEIQRVLLSIIIDQCSLKAIRMSYKDFAVTGEVFSFEHLCLIYPMEVGRVTT